MLQIIYAQLMIIIDAAINFLDNNQVANAYNTFIRWYNRDVFFIHILFSNFLILFSTQQFN